MKKFKQFLSFCLCQFFLALLRLSTLVPNRYSFAFAKILARCLLKLPIRAIKRRRHISLVNLRLCFPEKKEFEIQKLCTESFENMMISFFELALAFWLPTKKLKTMLHFKNKALLDQALQQQGVVFVMGHFSPIFLVGTLLAQHYHYNVVYFPQNSLCLRQKMMQHYQKYQCNPIANHQVRTISKATMRKEILWLPADQDSDKGTFAPFFKQTAKTLTSYARFAKMGGAANIPFHYYRFWHEKSRSYHYCIEIDEAINFSDDSKEQATLYNQILEGQIRKHPSQYFWAHRRFKSQPDRRDLYQCKTN